MCQLPLPPLYRNASPDFDEMPVDPTISSMPIYTIVLFECKLFFFFLLGFMDCGEITFLSRSGMLLQSDVFLIDNIMNELYNNLSSLFLLCAFYML
jgi:hypothetical protein